MSDPRLRQPGLFLPTVTQRTSGIWVPSSVTEGAREGVTPAGLLGEPDPVAVVRRAPTGLDLLGVGPDEEVLGWPTSTPEQIIGYAASLPFEPAMLMLSWLDAALFLVRHDRGGQVRLAEAFFGEASPVARGLAAWVAADDAHFAFDERQLAIFRGLLVLHAQPVALGGVDVDPELFTRGLFAVSALSEAGADVSAEPEPDLGSWLRFLVRGGAYYELREPLQTIALAHALWVDLARRPELCESPAFCPVDEWLREDYGGFAADEQLAIGFGLLAATGVTDEEREFIERAVVDVAFASESALADRQGDIVDIVGADRDFYARRLANAELGVLAWERTPLEQRPFLRLADGRLLLTSPRAMWSWSGDGLYYRLLDAARRRSLAERFTQFFGTLTERYVVELVSAAHPGPRLPGGGRVFGEQHAGTRRAAILTPDVTVDLGPDLVLIEVVSGRLTAATRVTGNNDALRRDLVKLVDNKLDQLARRIGDFFAGRMELPDVRPGEVDRVWPVLVVTEGVTVAEPLWEHIRKGHRELFADARVQIPTILDSSELEHLTALVEGGESLAGLLAARARSGYGELPVRRWLLAERPEGAASRRPSLIAANWEAAAQLVHEVLYPGRPRLRTRPRSR